MSDAYPRVDLSGTGYEIDGATAFGRSFRRAMSFHFPEGLAAVWDESGAYHINVTGAAAYPMRYREVYGFYEGLSTVRDEDGFLHIGTDGRPVHERRFRWSGNFQEGLCAVQDDSGFFHVRRDGCEAYRARHAYAGDFVNGVAVVHQDHGAWHIRSDGSRLHSETFRAASPYHKGAAVVEDDRGAFHVGVDGGALHPHRFKVAEPFYNGVALCFDAAGRRVRLHESGFYCLAPGPSEPVGTRELRDHVRAGGTAALLLRHAEREDITEGWGEEVRLTERGRAQAERLGRLLADAGVRTLSSSPVGRCVQTAEQIATGAGRSGLIELSTLLGAPGAFHDSMCTVDIRPEEFGDYATRYLEVGRARGMVPLEQACKRLTEAMGSSTRGGMSVLVSHDLFVAGLARFLGLKRVHRHDWADFLEGVCLLEGPGAPPRWRMFHGLREVASC